MKSTAMKIAGLAAVAAIALTWSAIAADEGKRDGGQGAEGKEQQAFGPRGEGGPPRGMPPRHHGPGGPGGRFTGPAGGELTNGELNVQRDGEAVTVRIDHGEIASVDSDSITVAENDGNDVEIALDDATEVKSGPFRGELTIEDLEQGDRVHVVREGDGAAKVVGVLPDGPPPAAADEER